MKSIIAAGFLLGCAHGAIAGPYANIEANSGYTGSDYTGTATDVHVGYEGKGSCGSKGGKKGGYKKIS